ncbi:hypothetical protein BCB4_0124 [Bacillus phage B4]|uniref:Uncharacterized protein n=2 Tax=Bequatrovirus B4 TaxID=1918005 RepID=J9PRG6_9CAUD|nr:hypothetical protein BCB4_0124 [Bacillus phage B4]YP_009783716.1 hypothetical protein QLX26_gp120 [Bacillus phage B5S]MEB9013978.1 hypothetical protein [Bacillus cereus]AEW47354.1 hypothetical protein B5S_0120 [Bacillus phage B5S]AEZ65917.1 hypothetical protein BCB4_0124 [Bacillus phage B4]MEB9190675.1 hypothetical protein [Bacillus cereus]
MTVKRFKTKIISYVAVLALCGGGLHWAIEYRKNEIREAKREIAENMTRTVVYELVSIEGDEYLAIGNEFDKRGMRQGINLTPQQVGKRLEIGDKVIGVWKGKNLVNVIAK